MIIQMRWISFLRYSLSCVVICLFTGLSTPVNSVFPESEISNGVLKVKLWLPDHEKGYYRGIRFDRSGVISSLEYDGHQYFGLWYARHHPTHHDAITGPVDEFTPLGFEEVKAGQEFIKIGVGSLIRSDDKDYSFSKMYAVKDAGKWVTSIKEDHVVFTHTLQGADGYAYEYQKTVRLMEGAPKMTLEHRLKNTGQKHINTSTYNHNFFVIDQEPTGPFIRTTFKKEISAEGRNFGEIIFPKGNSLEYGRYLKMGENVYTANITATDNSILPYDLKIENTKTGAGVRISGDKPLEKMVFWACHTTSCPEPYIRLSISPGEEVKWNITYEFFVNK